MDTLKFSLDRIEKPVEINGETFTLVELDGRERDRYLTSLTRRVRTDKSGDVSGVKDFDGLQASLVSASLYRGTGDSREHVPTAEIQKWPARVVSALFDAAKELSALNEEDEEEAEKND